MQTTCYSFSPISNPKFVYSLLRSVAGSSPSSSSSPNFPNCFSSRKSASVFADYLRSHFSVSQPKALRGRTRGYLFELRQATCQEESHLSFCLAFSPSHLSFCSPEFLAHLNFSNLSRPLPLARQSFLSHAKAPSSLWHGFSFSHF